MYCEIIFIRWTFYLMHFVGRAIKLKTFKKYVCYLKKYTYSSFLEPVHHCQTTNYCAHAT